MVRPGPTPGAGTGAWTAGFSLFGSRRFFPPSLNLGKDGRGKEEKEMRFARPLAVLAAIAAMAAPAGTAMAAGASGGTDAWPTLIATAAGGNSGGHYGTDTTGGMSAYVPFRKAIDGFAMKDGATYTVPDATGWHTFDENGSKTEENGVTSMWSHTCAVLVGVKTAVFGGKDVTDGSLPDGWKATAT